MSIQTPAGTEQPSPGRVPQARHRRSSAGPTVLLSLAVGAAAAMVLSLLVLGGAEEARITGALLLGFGAGWALMAVLTVRRTEQPQWWASVPAAAMGATGAALVVFNPGDETLTALGWVWPPVLLTLGGWMYVQARRSPLRKARWALNSVIAVLALVSVGATYDNVARTVGPDYAAPGTLYDVGDHRLHLDCRGHGSPTVLLANGLGGVSAGWARIAGPVAEDTRVCTYDRAGQGWSEDVDAPLDGVESAEDLHTLLAVAGERGPYVLVGHSTGGTYAMTYAARYPEEVAGLVLLDSSSPEQFDRLPAYPGQYEVVLRRGLALLPTLRRVGLEQVLPETSHLPADDAERVAALTSSPRAARNQRDEISVLPEVFSQAQALTTLGDRPLIVLTASENAEGVDGWDGAQDQLATLSTNSSHRTVDSSHTGLLQDPGPAAESVEAITAVIASVRTGGH